MSQIFDRISVKTAILLNKTLAEMEQLRDRALITERTFNRYYALWLWSACRESNKHDKFYAQKGKEAYWQRIDANVAMIKRIKTAA